MALRQLHHQPEIDNIRSAYDSDDKFFHSDYDYEQSHSSSDRSYPTKHSVSSNGSANKRPPKVHNSNSNYNNHNTYHAQYDSLPRFLQDRPLQDSPQASVATYASTVLSEDDIPEEEEPSPQYMVPEYRASPYQSTAVPATPTDFSDLFPSHRRLTVRHDDSTLDGNMNLRIDTEVAMHGGRRSDMTLFHLRMHDLRNREFSFRRYCRDSGREVCHTARKLQKPSLPKRPGFQRSLSNALNSIRPKSEQHTPTMASLKRNDSGYGSAHSSLDFDRDDRPRSAHGTTKSQQPVDLNTIKLEFSNYAQLEVKRAGVKGSKRYEFEYWGVQYAWRRIVRKDAHSKDVSFHLTRSGDDSVLAYIITSPLTQAQREEERAKGGWVPPCSMWIADEDVVRGQKDVADVIISSGLIALVDSSIRARFQSKHSQQLFIPKLGFEYIGPRRLINEMFKRDGSGPNSRQSSVSCRPSK